MFRHYLSKYDLNQRGCRDLQLQFGNYCNVVFGASSYNIYYADTPGVTKSTGTKITDATKPYEITGLTNGTTYYFVVTAVNAFGESSESVEVSATPDTIPAKPKGSSAYSGNTQAVVYCQPVKSATSYNLYYSTTADVNTTNYTDKITGMTNPQTVTGLLNGTTYYFVITAVNGAVEGPISSETTATPSATQPQPPPSPAGVTATATGATTITSPGIRLLLQLTTISIMLTRQLQTPLPNSWQWGRESRKFLPSQTPLVSISLNRTPSRA